LNEVVYYGCMRSGDRIASERINDLTAPPSYRLEMTATPDPAERASIAVSLLHHNESFLGWSETRPLAVVVRSAGSGKVAGGLWGRTSYGWLFIEMVFLPAELRGRRISRDLMRMAEAEAQSRGCIGAWLDTFSAGAKGFYQRQGYETFGEINDYPPGQSRFFMRKRLGQSSIEQ
jgi:ribosomal protein S18 acetylase RimI-like enzyme